MADKSVAIVILAAGQGSRMQSDLPKVLHRLAGVPLVGHALSVARTVDPEQVIVVAGHGADQVTKAVGKIDPDARIVLQSEQLGTGHAVRQALPELEGFEGKVIVLYGDTPFIGEETLAALAAHPSDLVVLGFEAEDPGRYGRLIVTSRGLERIVEFKDADAATREIALCNSGVMALDASLLRQLIVRLTNENASGEYYLTDLVALARAEGRSTDVVTCDESETLGINTRAELAGAEAAFQDRARRQALLAAAGIALLAVFAAGFDLLYHITWWWDWSPRERYLVTLVESVGEMASTGTIMLTCLWFAFRQIRLRRSLRRGRGRPLASPARSMTGMTGPADTPQTGLVDRRRRDAG